MGAQRTATTALASLGAAVALSLVLLLALFAAPSPAASDATFPETIPLPDGFQPEGIAVGHGTAFYAGSLANGAIYKGDLRTGAGEILVEGFEGGVAVGLAFDNRTGYLYVAGNGTGMAWVYDAETGEEIAAIQLADPSAGATFINDVAVTRDAAYFTDSARPYLYEVELNRDGSLPESPSANELMLSGDFAFTAGEFNANGIEATQSGAWLLVVNSFAGELYRVDPDTGEASLIDLGGESVSSGDGILLRGKTLYVVRNFLNQIAAVRLSNDWLSGRIVDTITSDGFDIPTTVAGFGSALYAVNARFSTTPEPTTEYWITKVPAR